MAATVPPVSGFEFFGIKLFEDQSEKDADAVIADPVSYSVTFNTSGAEKDIADIIRNSSDLGVGQNEPASGVAGLVAKARGDYRRILGSLYDQGYYGGTVSITLNGVEAAKVAPDAKMTRPVAVAIAVNPGPLFHFRNVSIVNRAPASGDPNDRSPTPESLGFVMGGVARGTIVLRAEQAQIEAWRRLSYAKAAAGERKVVADHRANALDVVITIDPGRQAAFGEVTVTGTERMDPEFVRQQTGLAVGEPFSPDAVSRAQKRLARLEVFRSIRLEAAESIGIDGLLPYNIIVQEQALHRFGAGATFSTVDGLGFEGFWLKRNLFGRAERIRLDAKVAGIAFPINTAQFDYAFGGTFTKPGFLTPDTDLIAAVSAERTFLDNYTETSLTARAGLTHYLSDEITLEGGLAYKRARFDDDFGTRDFSTLSAYGGGTFDNRDDKTDAHSGWYLNGRVEPFYDLNYGVFAAQTMAEARTYFALGDSIVLAGRVKAGLVVGPSLAEIPPDKLFFAGGGGSVRGYGFRSIGVDGPNGTTTGGRYLLEGSVEARYRFNNDFGAVAFVDGGYVAADTFPDISQLRLGAGVGLRYYTGLGPLRLDVAIPLNKRSGDPNYALYLGIGQAF
ncbi:autotransporter assembly complex protein TamA [Paradevosia shaoguanensis]|uniref:Autotransporter assembly complex protein TamA n=1 Tax=Paradevosia shaoguanensis TaxID=1335043 RepID=A0AA41U9K6_9HYPH|nr:autotransporter assembly complex family protein [Paradevosia shaoguanensis]MCF1740869.1 autotransporter assembly complex protein TamA [Paradevosia shaoguanensis]MCI0125353.1 autotransporter assembly complex protein TamA [Paradevosia shaoguanensis]